ncbi:MAG: hypothetical protein J6B81_05140 [Spirochaetaceae bacterium]|nr:hypothetical protein [Spirochaetaceae bacterium]
MFSNISTANAYSYHSAIYNSGAKVQVPVNPQYVVYSQLEHISGVAARKNQQGINLNKIQILNTLIDNLVSLKKNPEPSKLPSTPTDNQIENLIQTYQDQIHTAIKAAEANPFALTGVALQPGAIFNIAV